MSNDLTPEEQMEQRQMSFKHLCKDEHQLDVWCGFKPKQISYGKYVGYRVFQLYDTTCFDCLGTVALWGQDAATRMMDLEKIAITEKPPEVVDELGILKMNREELINHLVKELFKEDITMLTYGMRKTVILARTRLNSMHILDKVARRSSSK